MLTGYFPADMRLSTSKSSILPNVKHVKIINIGEENNSCPSPPTDNYHSIHFTCPPYNQRLNDSKCINNSSRMASVNVTSNRLDLPQRERSA